MATEAGGYPPFETLAALAPQGEELDTYIIEEKVNNNKDLRRDAEARALDGAGDGGHIRPGGQAHIAALEIDRDRRGAGAGGGTGDGFDAAVAIHAGDLEDEFLSHVI
jgi:hypothetical protein